MYQKSDFNYHLPEELIARYPLSERSASKMLVAENHDLTDKKISDLIDYLNAEDLLIFNNTRVLPARLFGKKETGGKVEILIERVIDDYQAWAYLGASKTPKIGQNFLLNDLNIQILDRQEALFLLQIQEKTWWAMMEEQGELPIPPYFNRPAEAIDNERYQTVFAKNLGAVAAPTAGLHFDEGLLNRIREKGVQTAEITLHVGAGTFQPVRHDDLSQHMMHRERYQIPTETYGQIIETKRKNGRIIAVGTTSLRSLEGAWAKKVGENVPLSGETNIFIYPPYEFQIVDGLLTNFHLPESTLLMLVSAFLGYDETKSAYEHAIKNQYRFYSYGDCLFIPKHI